MSARAEIYDLGYKRYAGPRRSVSQRWRVIARNQIDTGIKGFWRWKLSIGFTIMATTISAIIMFIYQDKAVGIFADKGQRLADTVVPLAVTWYCKIALIVSLAISCLSIADDIAAGAFTFYFARSTRPVDYVLGKFVGLFVLIAPIMIGGPLILAGIQLALTPEGRSVTDELIVLPKVLLIGTLGTLVYSAVPMGFSALSKSRVMALGGWAIYYFMVGMVGNVMAFAGLTHAATLDIAGDLAQLSLHIFNLDLAPHEGPGAPALGLVASLLGVLIPVIASPLVALWRVKQAADTGVGGAS
jgi:ABC-2 type transport system permease protein